MVSTALCRDRELIVDGAKDIVLGATPANHRSIFEASISQQSRVLHVGGEPPRKRGFEYVWSAASPQAKSESRRMIADEPSRIAAA
jgi:hypothetical protein